MIIEAFAFGFITLTVIILASSIVIVLIATVKDLIEIAYTKGHSDAILQEVIRTNKKKEI